jgi:glucose-6-phosphate isomerase
MLYRQEIESCFTVAPGDQGLAQAEFAALGDQGREAVAKLRRALADGSLPLLRLPARRDDFNAFAPVAHRFATQFERVVVLGTGGSSLGGIALTALAPAAKVTLHFEDNLDAGTLGRLAESDLSRTAILAISKSGSTAETMAQILTLMAAPKVRPANQFVFVTEPGDNVLRRLAARHGIEVLDHDPKVGGRFSVLSIVGLLPASIAGLSADKVRRGAALVLDQTLNDPLSPAVQGAALQVALQRHRGIQVSVLMPYDSRLDAFGRWYAQLWAESLGKQGHGTVPVRALGPVDQHSQLQLYLDGPRDKLVTFVMVEHMGAGPIIDTAAAGNDPELAYLNRRRIGDLVAAQARATAETLINHGRPVRNILLPRLDEETMGALLMHFMLETIIAAHLLGVDPFDQPAVEESKHLTRQYLRAMTAP